MVNKVVQYTVGKDYLYYLYRFVILPWELEWKNCKFLISKGNLNDFCSNNNINIKSFTTTNLKTEIDANFDIESKNYDGILWFVRNDTKPKDALARLRNAFAHGDFKKRQKNKVNCLFIEQIYNNDIKIKGYIPLDKLKGLIDALESCNVSRK